MKNWFSWREHPCHIDWFWFLSRPTMLVIILIKKTSYHINHMISFILYDSYNFVQISGIIPFDFFWGQLTEATTLRWGSSGHRDKPKAHCYQNKNLKKYQNWKFKSFNGHFFHFQEYSNWIGKLKWLNIRKRGSIYISTEKAWLGYPKLNFIGMCNTHDL